MRPLLKPGDVVRIRDDISHMGECNAGLVQEMYKFGGTLVTILEIAQYRGQPRTSRGSYLYYITEDEDELYWSDDLFDWTYVPEEESVLDISCLL